jgi:hypothetical protein
MVTCKNNNFIQKKYTQVFNFVHKDLLTYNIPMHRFYPKMFLSALLTKLSIIRVEDEDEGVALSAMHENKIFRK